MAKSPWNGGAVEVAIVVQSPAPAGLRWNSSASVSASEVADSAIVPRANTPGSPSVGVGTLLSTVTVRPPVVEELPARSVTTASIVAVPSETPAESQVVRYGAPVSVATVEPFTRISTEATREVASLAATAIETSPLTSSPCAGEPTVPVGAVLSTILDGSVVVVTLAGTALSVTMKRRS